LERAPSPPLLACAPPLRFGDGHRRPCWASAGASLPPGPLDSAALDLADLSELGVSSTTPSLRPSTGAGRLLSSAFYRRWPLGRRGVEIHLSGLGSIPPCRVASNVTRRRFPPAAASRPEAPGGPLHSIRSRFTAAAAAHLQDPRPVKVGARYWPVQLQGDAAQDLHPRIQDALLEWTANSSFVRQGGLDHLEELRLAANSLISLPDTIGLLSNLKVLNVSSNRLRALPVASPSVGHWLSLM